MKKEMPQWAVVAIGIVAVAVLAGVGYMVLGQAPSGPGPNAENLPKLLDQDRTEMEQNESKPPTTPGGQNDPRSEINNRGR